MPNVKKEFKGINMIENFEIVKYKCFENFKLERLSRINIITGDNNVGKTALLEAINLSQIDSYDAVNTAPIIDLVINRGVVLESASFENYIRKLDFIAKVNNKKISIQFKYPLKFSEKEQEAFKIHKDSGNKEFLVIKWDEVIELVSINNIEFYHNMLAYPIIVTRYINSSKPEHNYLAKLYSAIQSKGIQHKFLEYLQLLDNNIKWIEPQLVGNEVYLRVNLANPEISLLSSELGEGTNRFIEILATILTTEEKVVLIDEIENGIYYKKFKNIWKAIIEIAEKEDIQLFVTTHNEDTIEALKEASEEVGFEDISSIELYKKDGVIYPIVRDYESFSYNVEIGMEIR